MYIKCGDCLWEGYTAYFELKKGKGEMIKCLECGSDDIFDNTVEPIVPEEYFIFPELEDC